MLSKKVIIITIVILLIVLVFSAFLFYNQKLTLSRANSYYAVFLSNGQVYFGHMTQKDTQTITLTNVYYLQASTSLTDSKIKDANNDIEFSLIKLGNELHGPKDYMVINNAQILFWEELRNDGRIVEAIKNNKQ